MQQAAARLSDIDAAQSATIRYTTNKAPALPPSLQNPGRRIHRSLAIRDA